MKYRIGDRVYPTDIDFIENIMRYEHNSILDIDDLVGVVVDCDDWKNRYFVVWLYYNRTRKIKFDHIHVDDYYTEAELTDDRKYFRDIVSDAEKDILG